MSLEEIPTHFQIIAKLIVPDSQDVGLTCHLLNLLSPSQFSVTINLFWSELDHVFNVLILCHRWHKIHIVEDGIYVLSTGAAAIDRPRPIQSNS